MSEACPSPQEDRMWLCDLAVSAGWSRWALSPASPACHLAGQAPCSRSGCPAVPFSRLPRADSTEGCQMPTLGRAGAPRSMSAPAPESPVCSALSGHIFHAWQVPELGAGGPSISPRGPDSQALVSIFQGSHASSEHPALALLQLGVCFSRELKHTVQRPGPQAAS